ncbi:ROK family protein [Arcanobacterium phocae]|uniref:ROK family protein n=2 Tax=Arcanobacterium phocae TaxID=131112 RepID=UPI001C0F22EB|nr:ROK family protein [Arcanobacterium phocae]
MRKRAFCDSVEVMTAGSHIQPRDPNSGINTLSLDFGGSRVKSAVLDQQGNHLGTYFVDVVEYPFTPQLMLETVIEHAQRHAVTCHRITIGMPGIVRDGIVIHTPHYIRPAGPGGSVDAQLQEAWKNTDIQKLVEDACHLPTLVVNDAIVAAAATMQGHGSELILTLGTGLGIAFAVNGRLTEHIEVSHAPSPIGGTFDDVVGAINLPDTDSEQWSHHIGQVIDALWPMYRWDTLYIGGGNALKLTDEVRASLSKRGATFLDYEAGARGGSATWQYVPHIKRGACD